MKDLRVHSLVVDEFFYVRFLVIVDEYYSKKNIYIFAKMA